MTDRLAKLAFASVALLPVIRASLRVWRLERSNALPHTAELLRRVPHFRLRGLARPEWLDGCVSRLLPLLPPIGYGRCLKRSLILLDLWSRCGLSPSLHLGYRRVGGSRIFHAWVTREGDIEPASAGHDELWSC